MSNTKEFSCAFVIPRYIGGYQQQYRRDEKKLIIADTIEGLFSQTDEDWSAIIVVDMPPDQETYNYLTNIKKNYYPKIDVIFFETKCRSWCK